MYVGLSFGPAGERRAPLGGAPAIRARGRDEARDRARVEELFRRHEREKSRPDREWSLVQIISSRALAEDLLQETFLSALAARGRLDAVRDPRAWLYGIARHQALGALRRSRRERRAYERLAREREPAAPDAQAALFVRDLLERHLGAEDRTLLVLRYLHGFSAEELAAMSGRSPEALRQRLSRARKALVRAAEETPPRDPRGAPLGARSP